MKRFVVLAGPQAAGKTTCLNKVYDVLRELYPCFPGNKEIEPFKLQEARQIVVHKYHAMGGIFLTKEQEKEIIEIDLNRMEQIFKEQDDRLLYFDECNVFTLGHAKAHGVFLAEPFLDIYLYLLRRLRAIVIFLDAPPDTSWARRRSSYQSRLYRFPEDQRDGIMGDFERYLHALYPALEELYNKIKLPKVKINADQPEEEVVKQIICFLREKRFI
jgi:thymidylate kinase